MLRDKRTFDGTPENDYYVDSRSEKQPEKIKTTLTIFSLDVEEEQEEKKPKLHGKKGGSQFGKSNGRWKGGRSKTYRRRITKAKPGQVVHHKDKNKGNNTPSNLEPVSPSTHNKKHPEKGGNHKKKRSKK